jgi:hypothetical protein
MSIPVVISVVLVAMAVSLVWVDAAHVTKAELAPLVRPEKTVMPEKMVRQDWTVKMAKTERSKKPRAQQASHALSAHQDHQDLQVPWERLAQLAQSVDQEKTAVTARREKMAWLDKLDHPDAPDNRAAKAHSESLAKWSSHPERLDLKEPQANPAQPVERANRARMARAAMDPKAQMESLVTSDRRAKRDPQERPDQKAHPERMVLAITARSHVFPLATKCAIYTSKEAIYLLLLLFILLKSAIASPTPSVIVTNSLLSICDKNPRAILTKVWAQLALCHFVK